MPEKKTSNLAVRQSRGKMKETKGYESALFPLLLGMMVRNRSAKGHQF
jgi:hypothetical protein